MEKLLGKMSFKGLKSSVTKNLKSSERFGETSVFSKNLSVFSNNLRLLLKERRFLYFTKKGPIEVVFNLKHYISAFILFLAFLFKVFQLIFFGFSSFFSYLTYKNTEITSKSFTESEIKTLKDIAQGKSIIYQKNNSEKVEIVINKEDEMNIDKESSNEIQRKLKQKLVNLKNMMGNIKIDFPDDLEYSDEVKFEQFSKIASPEMKGVNENRTRCDHNA